MSCLAGLKIVFLNRPITIIHIKYLNWIFNYINYQLFKKITGLCSSNPINILNLNVANRTILSKVETLVLKLFSMYFNLTIDQMGNKTYILISLRNSFRDQIWKPQDKVHFKSMKNTIYSWNVLDIIGILTGYDCVIDHCDKIISSFSFDCLIEILVP